MRGGQDILQPIAPHLPITNSQLFTAEGTGSQEICIFSLCWLPELSTTTTCHRSQTHTHTLRETNNVKMTARGEETDAEQLVTYRPGPMCSRRVTALGENDG